MGRKDTGEAALTVYGPEVLVSGLVRELDGFLAREAGVTLAERFFVLHDASSITQFYNMTGSTTGAHWPLVVDLFDGRPCLASIWSGADALARIQRLKGATQPCNASSDTIRGNFACDNPVCNLIHVSDSTDLALEEISLLRGRAMGAEVSAVKASPQWLAAPGYRHSSLWTFANVLERIEPCLTAPPPPVRLPDAQASATQVMGWLQAVGHREPRVRGAVNAYLEGSYTDVLSSLPSDFRMTAWERLIIECGCHAAPLWLGKLFTGRSGGGEQPCR